MNNYYRDLNLETAISTTRFSAEGVNYTREVFVSFSDQVIVVHLNSSVKGKLNFSIGAKTLLPAMLSNEDNEIVLSGRAPFTCRSRLLNNVCILSLKGYLKCYFKVIWAKFLLPALPDAWQKGAVSGLRALGGYSVAMVWDKGKLTSATITSDRDGECKLRTNYLVKIKGVKLKSMVQTSPEGKTWLNTFKSVSSDKYEVVAN